MPVGKETDMNVQAVVFPAEDQIEIREVGLPEIQKDHLRAETLYTFVSPGTELRTLAGHYGADKKYPLIPGYSTISRVVEVGSAVKGYQVGDLLSTRGGGEFIGAATFWGGEAGGHVFRQSAPIVKLPPGAAKNPLPYAVAEVAAISYRGVLSADPRPGEHAVVIGQGMIGTFAAEFLRLKGCLVTVCDISAERLAVSREAGFTTVELNGDDSVAQLLAYGSGGFDIVAECSGSAAGFKTAVQLIRQDPRESMRRLRKDWPRLLLQGNYVDEIPLNPCWFFAGEGLTVLTPADRLPDDRQQVVELIRSGKWDPSPYLKKVFTPAEMPDAYRKLQKREISSAICQWRDL